MRAIKPRENPAAPNFVSVPYDSANGPKSVLVRLPNRGRCLELIAAGNRLIEFSNHANDDSHTETDKARAYRQAYELGCAIIGVTWHHAELEIERLWNPHMESLDEYGAEASLEIETVYKDTEIMQLAVRIQRAAANLVMPPTVAEVSKKKTRSPRKK